MTEPGCIVYTLVGKNQLGFRHGNGKGEFLFKLFRFIIPFFEIKFFARDYTGSI